MVEKEERWWCLRRLANHETEAVTFHLAVKCDRVWQEQMEALRETSGNQINIFFIAQLQRYFGDATTTSELRRGSFNT